MLHTVHTHARMHVCMYTIAFTLLSADVHVNVYVYTEMKFSKTYILWYMHTCVHAHTLHACMHTYVHIHAQVVSYEQVEIVTSLNPLTGARIYRNLAISLAMRLQIDLLAMRAWLTR
jgi:hypothetical protein